MSESDDETIDENSIDSQITLDKIDVLFFEISYFYVQNFSYSIVEENCFYWW